MNNQEAKYTKLMTLYYATQNPLGSGEGNKNSLNTESVYSESVRRMVTKDGEQIPGTSINYHGFTIPANNSEKSGIPLPLVNEHARIVLPGGFINIWGEYADTLDGTTTTVPTTVFFGNGTGIYKDVGCVRIFYDNETGLRRMVCYKME